MQGMTSRATHLLNVPTIRQKTDFACGNTALACVLQYHRKFYSADQLAELAGTKETGTDHANLVGAAQNAGLSTIAKSGGTLDELVSFIDRGLPVIVGWWSMDKGDKHYDHTWPLEKRAKRDCGHYSVLRGYTPTKLLFMDPQEDPVEKMTDKAFERVWYDTDTDDYHRVDRWYLLIHP
jgi:ABC-type bacteriocin/lantibiotic exporter with double-glycine peptidase domain